MAIPRTFEIGNADLLFDGQPIVIRCGEMHFARVPPEYWRHRLKMARQYIGILRDALLEAGFTVPLFTCDGPTQLKNDVRDDIFSVVNFASDPTATFEALRAIRPTGPLMCGEFYPGWFDSWGRPHHLGSTESVVKDLRASFSIYMAHGGTSFGFSAGANAPPFSPQSTSYDYDAPTDEAGNTTPKFFALRELFQQYLNPGETLPGVPASNATIEFAPFRLTESASIFSTLPDAGSEVLRIAGPERGTDAGSSEYLRTGVVSKHPCCMEMLDLTHGCILYRHHLPPSPAALLDILELHDFGLVLLDGKKIATHDRRHGQHSCSLPPRDDESTLDILVEAMGM